MSPEEEISRGRQAQELMDNPILKEAFEKIERETLELWAGTNLSDVETREDLWRLLNSARQLRRNILNIQSSGEIAKQGLLARGLNVIRPARVRTNQPIERN